MKDSTNPTFHRECEKQVIDHVERLLGDDRLRVDTTGGRRPVMLLRRDVRKDDREVDLKRLMSEMGMPDRELQARMPVGRQMTVNLSRTTFLLFRKTVGRLKVVCHSPSQELLAGEAPQPMAYAELKTLLSELNEREGGPRVPMTLVVMSTSGFAPDARELAERRADRTVILLEPNQTGGWTSTGPPETKALVDLFDPELDADKRQRVREEIEKNRAELLGGGLDAQRIAATTKLSLQLVEDELKSYAKEVGGLVARRLEGNVVLFRDGTAPLTARSGGSDMPFIQRVKALFARKGDNEKKISLLSERRAMLSLQRDRSYEEIGVLEDKENSLRQQFKDTSSSLAKRRVTSQLLQLRKDMERRQQLLGMLNQQINIVSTHLHNLELVQQGQTAQLPDSEELAADAAAAEEVLAELQAGSELAGSISAAGAGGLSAEEQALYEELEREATGGAAPKVAQSTTTRTPATPESEPREPAAPARAERPREPEPG